MSAEGRRKRFLAATLGALVLLAGAAVGHRYLGAPAHAPLPLPPALIAADSAEGRELLAESGHVADYAVLRAHFQPQARRAYCGVASAVIALNALRPAHAPLDQRSFFHDPARAVRHPLHVSYAGMPLGILGELLETHDADAEIVRASDTSLDAFRAAALRNLATPGDYVLVNYQRAELGQARMGHISPLAAYHAGSDRFLVLDVAAHKYPPVWVETETLWKAMRVPVASGRPDTRGFVLVRERAAPRTTAQR